MSSIMPEGKNKANETLEASTFKISNTTAGFIGGTLGGIAGVITGHPFDTIKVRLQSPPNGETLYRGTLHCTTSIFKKEGIFGFFKGMSSPLVGVALMNSLLFGTYGAILNLQKSTASEEATLKQIFIAGSVSGFINSIISCPMELVKIQMQNHVEKKPNEPVKKYDLVSLSRKIYEANGIRGLFRGFPTTIIRETPSYGAYFVTYEVLCRSLAPAGTDPKDLSGVSLMIAGGIGGIVGWVSTYPIDVAKTVIQADKNIFEPKSKPLTLGNTLSTLYKNNGVTSLFRGLFATIIRAFPTNVAILSTWHLTMLYLRKYELIIQDDE